MKILITGGNGLLAHALKQVAPKELAPVLLNHQEFDLTQPDQMAGQLKKHASQVVINTAAYNLVDRCEIERDLSWAVNATGPEKLAELCAAAHCRLVHYSTDYVFDGTKKSSYLETDPPGPLNHYAAGKLAGEQAVLRASPDHLVLRTSWIFGNHPMQAKSYVHTVLKNAKAGRDLKATTDQVSVPTYAPDLARWTLEFLKVEARGLFHAVNDDGVSRFEWTRTILEEARQAGLTMPEVKVEPVTSDYFNATMRRPAYTVLNNAKATGALGHPLGSWREGLREMLGQIPRSG